MAQNPLIDDQSIIGDSKLFRRIFVRPNVQVVWDANRNKWRPSSAAFQNSSDGSPMSVVLEVVLQELERDYESVLVGHDNFACAYISAQLARNLQQGIVRDPVPEELAHGLVFGNKPPSVRRKMAEEAEWLVAPDLDAR